VGAMDHKPGKDCECDSSFCEASCIWCCEPWPCEAAKIRHELAELIRASVANDKANRPKFNRGRLEAADDIDALEKP